MCAVLNNLSNNLHVMNWKWFFCHVLMRVTDRVDCQFRMCVCPPDSRIKHSVFYVYLCSCTVLVYCVLFYLYLLCSRKANFYVIHSQ